MHVEIDKNTDSIHTKRRLVNFIILYKLKEMKHSSSFTAVLPFKKLFFFI